MKIRNLSKLALAVAISSSVVFEGCKKYDDDITRLEQSIDQNKSDIATLKSQLQSLAATNVVESVTSIAGGFRIVFKSPTGQTTSYDVVNGAAGAKGDKGDKGDKGEAGAAGTQWRINPTSGLWESSTNGTTWTPTTVKAQGTAGTNGSTPEIRDVNGKKYWFIDGKNTNVLAYGGDIALVAVDGGYNIVMTSAEGKASSTVFLAKEQTSVNSLTFVAKNHIAQGPVATFPRIVKSLADRTTVMQGSGALTYKLNPYGVNPSNYQIEGLIANTSDLAYFRSGANSLADFTVSTLEQKYDEVTVLAKPGKDAFQGITPTGTDKFLNVALQVKNTKSSASAGIADSAAYRVVSNFAIAKEEIIQQSELTIEVAEKGLDGKYSLASNVLHNNPAARQNYTGYSNTIFGDLNNGNGISATAINSQSVPTIKLNLFEDAEREITSKLPSDLGEYKYRGGINLNETFRGFYYKTLNAYTQGASLQSLDDNGLAGYTLSYELVDYTDSQGNNHKNDVVIKNGVLQVKERTSGEYNTASNLRTPVLKITMKTPDGTTLATKFAKVQIVRASAKPIEVKGTATYAMTNTDGSANVNLVEPSTLDAAYNRLGLDRQSFFNTYYFDYSSVSYTKDGQAVSGISVAPASYSNNTFALNIARTVLPGTYVIQGQYISTGRTPVEVLLTLTVTGNNITTISKHESFWSNGIGIITGRLEGSAWKLNANVWDLWKQNTSTTSNAPVTTFVVTKVTNVNGITVDNANNNILLDETNADAKKYINTNTTVSFKIETYVNGVHYAANDQTFAVAFKNPVKPLVIRSGGEMKDKENSTTNESKFDLRKSFSVSDFNNNVMYLFDGASATSNKYNTGLLGQYGMSYQFGANQSLNSGLATFVRAENASGATISLPAQTTATVVGNEAVWTNRGASLQSDIYLVYKIKVANKFNTGSVDATKAEVEKEVRIRVKPNN